jgi:hypothetical protein
MEKNVIEGLQSALKKFSIASIAMINAITAVVNNSVNKTFELDTNLFSFINGKLVIKEDKENGLGLCVYDKTENAEERVIPVKYLNSTQLSSLCIEILTRNEK